MAYGELIWAPVTSNGRTGVHPARLYAIWAISASILVILVLCFMRLLSPTTPTTGWVLLEIFSSIGSGIIMPSLLPAMQAELSDLDTTTATTLLLFARSFGTVWGSTIPSIIFNNQFDHYAGHIHNSTVVAELVGGQVYSRATSSFINSLSSPTRDKVIWTYNEALKLVWYVRIAFCAAGLLIVFAEKKIKLRTDLETEFGMTEREKENTGFFPGLVAV